MDPNGCRTSAPRWLAFLVGAWWLAGCERGAQPLDGSAAAPPPTPHLAPPPPPHELGRSISAGPAYACLVDARGALLCWGDNRWGQLGDGSRQARTAPVSVGLPSGWASVSAGGRCADSMDPRRCSAHTCGIQADGSLWCWGRNWAGQLGDGTTEDRLVPVRVDSNHDWLAVRAGPSSTCGLRAPGTLWCWGGVYAWGYDFITSAGPSRPARVTDHADFVQVDLGGEPALSRSTGCAVRATGELWCWSELVYFRTAPPDGFVPPRVAGRREAGTDWLEVAVAGRSQCGRKRDGSVWCAGSSGGDASFERMIGPGATALTAAPDHACATVGGEAFCWGANEFGQLGDGSRLASRTTVKVEGTGWGSLAAGDGFTCGLRSDGSAWCWGRNYAGELGVGFSADKRQPQRVGQDPWTTVSAGHLTTSALRRDGTLWSWGQLSAGGWGAHGSEQEPQREGEAAWSALALGHTNRCGVRQDGGLWCWDFRSGPQGARVEARQVGARRDWSSVSVSDRGACALRRDGALHCFGDGMFFAAGPDGRVPLIGEPPLVDAGPWAQVSVIDQSACAVHADATLWCWGLQGRESYRNLIADRPTRFGDEGDWASVATGHTASCGLRRDGAISCWPTYAHEPLVPGQPLRRPQQHLGAGRRWSNLTTSRGQACALDEEGQLTCWRFQVTQPLALEATALPDPTPGRRWSMVSVGGHLCGVDREGGLWCWGDNGSGQLGDGQAWRVRPQRVALP